MRPTSTIVPTYYRPVFLPKPQYPQVLGSNYVTPAYVPEVQLPALPSLWPAKLWFGSCLASAIVALGFCLWAITLPQKPTAQSQAIVLANQIKEIAPQGKVEIRKALAVEEENTEMTAWFEHSNESQGSRKADRL